MTLLHSDTVIPTSINLVEVKNGEPAELGVKTTIGTIGNDC